MLFSTEYTKHYGNFCVEQHNRLSHGEQHISSMSLLIPRRHSTGRNCLNRNKNETFASSVLRVEQQPIKISFLLHSSYLVLSKHTQHSREREVLLLLLLWSRCDATAIIINNNNSLSKSEPRELSSLGNPAHSGRKAKSWPLRLSITAIIPYDSHRSGPALG